MKKTNSLKRVKQCANCPWKVSTDPFDIPHGYDVEKHKDLDSTIAKSPFESAFSSELKVMACHHSSKGNEQHCVGWIYHQRGVGNNIGLRMYLMTVDNIGELQVFGDQHEKFEDTLPKQ